MRGISATGLVFVPPGEEMDGRLRTGRCLPTRRVKPALQSVQHKQCPGIEGPVRCTRRGVGFGKPYRM